MGRYWNQDDNSGGGDGLHVLAPTPSLVQQANDCDDFNDCSYVLLYRAAGGFRILFGGDSHDKTWEHILENHADDIADVDLLIAPHHGRKSNRDYGFLVVVRPKMTFFGNASSQHLAYGAWNYRNLPFITNNQAGCMAVYTNPRDVSLDL
jgi:beta-lactamase superfamily II metal-dependent hydrolase